MLAGFGLVFPCCLFNGPAILPLGGLDSVTLQVLLLLALPIVAAGVGTSAYSRRQARPLSALVVATGLLLLLAAAFASFNAI